jgi:SAM-dependent methyltransferase
MTRLIAALDALPPDTSPVTSRSAVSTNRRVAELLPDLDWSAAQLVDVGAGRGYFLGLLARGLEHLRQAPARHLHACDLFPADFEVPGLTCAQAGENGSAPFADQAFDAVVSIEVIEHLENSYAFLRELFRLAKPGATVIVTTPNTLHLQSRVRNLVFGFPTLFDPLPLDASDPRSTSGHILPIAPYFLAYAARRAGFVQIELFTDSRKPAALLLGLLLAPFLLLGRAYHRLRLGLRHPAKFAQNRPWLRAQNGLDLLLGRTTILRARRPADAGT